MLNSKLIQNTQDIKKQKKESKQDKHNPLGLEWYDYIIFLINIGIIFFGFMLFTMGIIFKSISWLFILGILFLYTAYASSEFLYKKTKNKDLFIILIITISASLIIGILRFLNEMKGMTL